MRSVCRFSVCPSIIFMLGICAVTSIPIRCLHASESAMRHEPLMIVGDRIFMTAGDDLGEIEDISAYCLGCHDASVGRARQAPAVPGADDPACYGLPAAHPIGSTYPMGDAKFSARESLPPSMYLSNGGAPSASPATGSEICRLPLPRRRPRLIT